MSTSLKPQTRMYKAAIYCRDNQVSDKEAADEFGLSPKTVKWARHQLRVPMPGKTRSEPGVAVRAAMEYINSDFTLDSFAAEKGIKKGSLKSALYRIGYKRDEERPNRRMMLHKGMYFFRLRQTGKWVFKKLCADLDTAREMRDRLERKYRARPR